MQLPSPSSTVIVKELNDGAVLYCSRTEVYFGVNEVGLAIWHALPSDSESTSTLDSLITTLGERFPEASSETILGDAREFLDALVRNGLVTPGVSADPGSAAD